MTAVTLKDHIRNVAGSFFLDLSNGNRIKVATHDHLILAPNEKDAVVFTESGSPVILDIDHIVALSRS